METVIEDARWQEFGLDATVQSAGLATLKTLGLVPDGYAFCVMGCDDARIAVLNTEFRGKPLPTNVLSWPSEERAAEHAGRVPHLPESGTAEEPEELGDIAIAFETCAREAEAAGKPMADHVTHLVVHGVLHLLGYDHQNDKDAELMEATETRILATLGLPDPY
jgi:probable rRNA maturation factor